MQSIDPSKQQIKNRSRKDRRRVALVRRDNIASCKLLVRVRGPDDLAGALIDHREGGEAIFRTELVAPARGDGVSTAMRRAAVRLRGGRARHDVGAVGRVGACVDAEGPGAFGVGGVADALKGGDGPLSVGDHHGFGRRGGGKGRRREGEGGEEQVERELHGCGVDCLSLGWVCR